MINAASIQMKQTQKELNDNFVFFAHPYSRTKNRENELFVCVDDRQKKEANENANKKNARSKNKITSSLLSATHSTQQQ